MTQVETRTPVSTPPNSGRHARQGSRLAGFRCDRWSLLLIPLLVFLAVVFIVPLVLVLTRSFTDPTAGLDNYREVLSNSLYVKVMVNTFTTALVVTVVTVALAFPYAYLMTLVSPAWRIALLIAVLIPFWTSLLIRSFALVLLLRDTGVINTMLTSVGAIDDPLPLFRNLTGVIFGMVQVTLPFAVLPLYATMSGIDRRLVAAAESLGARPAVAFWKVYFPQTVPGLIAGVTLVFIQALGYYITPALLGGPRNTMIGELIVDQVSTSLNFGIATALAVLLLAITFVLLAIAGRFVDVKKYLLEAK